MAIVLIPLFLMAFVLGGCARFQGGATELTPQAAAAGPTSQPRPTVVATDTPGDGVGLIRGPATPWAIPGGPGEGTATTQTAAAAAANAPVVGVGIVLQGPPAGSTFAINDNVSFYWQLPEGTVAGGRFTVYLDNGAGRVSLGSVDRANLGPGYHLRVALSEGVGEPGAFSWFVALEDSRNGAIIGQSESRPLTIIGGN